MALPVSFTITISWVNHKTVDAVHDYRFNVSYHFLRGHTVLQMVHINIVISKKNYSSNPDQIYNL